MRIQRTRSSRMFRRRRSLGCGPMTLVFGMLVGVLVVSLGWIGQRLQHQAPGPHGSLEAAQAAFAAGALDRTIDLATNVLEREPDRADALTLLVRALVYRSYQDYDRGADREAALLLTSAAIRRRPHDPDVMAAHAFALHAVGRSVDAFRTAERALMLDPDHTFARLAMGLSYGGVGSYDNALRELQRAARADVWQLDSLRALGVAFSDLGRYEEASQLADQAIALNPNLALLYFERALYALQIGDSDSATQAYFAILARQPDNVKVRLRMCELSSMLREHESALRYCGQVTELAPSWADGWYRLGREYFLQGDFVNAQTNLHRCSTLQTLQDVPIPERRFEGWYLQGQAAEINGDCEALAATYNEFRAMATLASISETWTYPPEGPPGCSAGAENSR